jgi:hypothetical protein
MREEVITITGILLVALSMKSEDERLNEMRIAEGGEPIPQEVDQMSVAQEVGKVFEEVASDIEIIKDPWEEYAEELHEERANLGEGLSPMERAFYQRFYPTAMMEQRRYGIPFSIKMAQGALEGNWGNSKLAREANNHFGIKTNRPGGYPHPDDRKDDMFRRYVSSWESWRDHSKFLRENPRYAPLFADKFDRSAFAKYSKNEKCLAKGSSGCIRRGLDPRFNEKLRDLERNWNTPYKRFAIGLSILNYATDVNYDRTLINLIEKKRFYESDI